MTKVKKSITQQRITEDMEPFIQEETTQAYFGQNANKIKQTTPNE